MSAKGPCPVSPAQSVRAIALFRMHKQHFNMLRVKAGRGTNQVSNDLSRFHLIWIAWRRCVRAPSQTDGTLSLLVPFRVFIGARECLPVGGILDTDYAQNSVRCSYGRRGGSRPKFVHR